MSLPKTWIICRICLEQNYGMLHLFTRHSDLPIWSILRDVADIPVRHNDNFSDKICKICLERLLKAHAFRLDCQRAHRKITQVVQYGGKKSCGFTPSNNVIMDMHQFADMSDNLQVESFKSSESNSSCITTNDDLNNSHAVPEAESKSKNHQNLVRHETTTISNGNILKENKPNMNCPTDSRLDKIPAKSKELQRIKMQVKGTANSLKNAKEYFSCKICENKFSLRQRLRQHLLIHIKPYACRICGKVFSRKHHLTNHLNTHYGKRPYPCRICSSRFNDNANRNKHERNVHKRTRFHNYQQPKEFPVWDNKSESESKFWSHKKE